MTSRTGPTSMPVNANDLIDVLRSPEAYPHDPESVQVKQTHASWVFLVDAYVYKIKKPVSLGFLDFSTLEKRKHFCEQEVRLNRRLCPDLYLGVVPISRSKDGYVLEDDRDIVEYAVKMRRLDGGAFAVDLVDEERLETSDLDRVVDVLAAFYDEETPSPEMAAWGRPDRLALSTDENFEQTLDFTGMLLSPPAFHTIQTYTDGFLDAHVRHFNERRAGGHILDCHGDLHLEHVYLKPDGVCIYDCIEFNERFRTIDVASDVAFLAMDLDVHGRPDLSMYFGERMADRLSDPDLLRLLDFYKCYRAVVRAKVEGMRSLDENVDEVEQTHSAERARSYFRLALRYATGGSQPLVLVVMGGVGTGKSTLAGQLGEALGCDVVSSDRVRKDLAGVDPYYRGSADERAALYSDERTEETYRTLSQRATDAVHVGRGIILDATYSHRTYRDDLRAALQKAGASYQFIEVTASGETVKERLAERAAAATSVSDARLEDFETLRRRYEAPDELEDACHVRVPSDDPGASPLESALSYLRRFDF
ncbi:MAG: AAA family ATPase [Rhodothermales bacterium]